MGSSVCVMRLASHASPMAGAFSPAKQCPSVSSFTSLQKRPGAHAHAAKPTSLPNVQCEL